MRQLFEGRAVTAVANDSVAILGLYVVICFFALAFGVVFGIVLPIEQYPASISTSASVDLYITTLAFGAFIFTLAMGSFFEVVWSGFDTVFVCFVHVRRDQCCYCELSALRRGKSSNTVQLSIVFANQCTWFHAQLCNELVRLV